MLVYINIDMIYMNIFCCEINSNISKVAICV